MKKLFVFMFVILIASVVYAASLDTRTENTAPSATDIIYVLVDPDGTPLDRKVTLGNAAKAMTSTNLLDTADLLYETELDTEAEIETQLTDVSAIFTNNVTGDVTISGNTSIIGANTVDGTMIAIGSDAQGDVMYYNGTDWVRLAAGDDGQQFETNGSGANPSWEWSSRKQLSCSANASTILAGTPVYAVSWNANGILDVNIADADNASALPAIGLAGVDLDTTCDAADSDIVIFSGILSGLDTSTPGWSEGDDLYVSTNGACTTNYYDCLTVTKPSGESSNIQKIGEVTRVNAGNGSILIFGAGRTNDLPNLDSGAIFVGSSGNVAAAVDMSGDVAIDNTGATTIQDGVSVTGWSLGASTATTPSALDNDTSLATTAFVQGEINEIPMGICANVVCSTQYVASNGSDGCDYTCASATACSTAIDSALTAADAANKGKTCLTGGVFTSDAAIDISSYESQGLQGTCIGATSSLTQCTFIAFADNATADNHYMLEFNNANGSNLFAFSLKDLTFGGDDTAGDGGTGGVLRTTGVGSNVMNDFHIEDVFITDFAAHTEAIIHLEGIWGFRSTRFVCENMGQVGGGDRDCLHLETNGTSGNGVIIRDSKIIQNVGGSGIRIENAYDITIDGGDFEIPDGNGIGIELVNADRVIIMNTHFDQVSALATGGDMINIDGNSDGVFITNNTFDANGATGSEGIVIQTGATPTWIVNNMFSTIASNEINDTDGNAILWNNRGDDNGTKTNSIINPWMYMLETSAALADKAGYGQWWVANTTPNRAAFTDDGGTDRVLAYVNGDTYTGTHDFGGAVIEVDNQADCSAITTEGQVCWDSDNDILYVGDGTTATAVGPGAGSGDITDVFNCATGNCSSIAVTDGDLLDFSNSNASSTTDGIILPQNTDCSAATAEGQICWDSDNDTLYAGDGVAANAVGGGSDTNALALLSWSAADTLPTDPQAAGFDGVAPVAKDIGTNLEVMTVSFDDTADECRGVVFSVPEDIDTSGTAQFYASWYSKTATTGSIALFFAWDVANEGETWDGTTTSEAAASDAVQGTVDLITETTWTETLTNLGWTADETVLGWICRDGDGTAATDDMTGDAELIEFKIELPRS